MEVWASEIRIRAERRLGELIEALKENGQLNKGARAGGRKGAPRGAYLEPRDTSPTLSDYGIDKKLSSRAQKIAAVLLKSTETARGADPHSPPQPLEPAAGRPRVPCRVPWVAVAEEVLQEPEVMPLVAEGIAGAVAEHVWPHVVSEAGERMPYGAIASSTQVRSTC